MSTSNDTAMLLVALFCLLVCSFKRAACAPVILNKPEEYIVGAGSNVTLSCSARGTQPLTFVWFQDEKNLTSNHSDSNSNTPPTTRLLEERRYEIQEEISPSNVTTSTLFLMNLKLTDTSVFLCWVENNSGFTIGNFSLIVNDSSPPVNLINGAATAGGSFGDMRNNIGRLFGMDSSKLMGLYIAIVVIVVLALILTAAVICLILLKYFTTRDDDEVAGNEQASNAGSSSDCDSSCANKSTGILADAELDGFIGYMRSGIINMDYHSMSPVMQFNKNYFEAGSQ